MAEHMAAHTVLGRRPLGSPAFAASGPAEPPKSALAAALEARPRPVHVIDVTGFFGFGDKPLYKIGFRVMTKAEQDLAVMRAHAYADHRSKEAPSAKTDDDLMLDAKVCEALFEACRRVEDGDAEQGYRYGVFPSPSWMREHLTTDQLGVLLNHYNYVRAVDGPLWLDITYEQVMTAARAVAAAARGPDSSIAQALIARAPREWLAEAFVVLALEVFNEDRGEESEPGAGDPSAGDVAQSGAGDGRDPSEVRSEGAGDARLPESDGRSGDEHAGGSSES